MTEALFLAEFSDPTVGDEITLSGDEGRHAVAVRRIAVGERILLADGAGTAVRGEVLSTEKASLSLRVDEVLRTPTRDRRYIAAQALAKGDRAELAVEVMTEMGIDEVVPWQAARSIVKWVPDRAERHLAKWRSTAREATKQSRRFLVPVVTVPMSTRELALRIPETALTLILHEEASVPLASVALPAAGDVMIVIGPEGGIAPDELEALTAAGGVPVSISDGVLRTSTAGVVALAQLQALGAR
ncbi:MAG TPA: 16S rRNA (uracil(1498)-N(3))-methyltransferase [Propioniciclava tarda]|nr:16S rRNA (uracil(1498)-N(3))-methyltransferase [Propioniciclava tarda]